MPKKDFSQIALGVVQRATLEAPKPALAPEKRAAPHLSKVATKKPAKKAA